MKLYGYLDEREQDLLSEVTLIADPATLRKLAEFMVWVASLMEEYGDSFGHEHFEDYDPAQRGGPVFVIQRGD